MFLSKPTITIFSSIAASSLPVVSIVVLYKIKSTIIDTNSSSTTKINEDVLIAEIPLPKVETPKSESKKEEVKTPPKKSEEPKPAEKAQEKIEEKSVTPKDNKEDKKEKKEDNSSDQTVTIKQKNNNSENSNLNKKQENKTESQQQLLSNEQLKQILEDFISGKNPFASSDTGDSESPDKNTAQLETKLQSFVKLLNHQKNSLNNGDEKKQITAVINALQQLETKIKNSKSVP